MDTTDTTDTNDSTQTPPVDTGAEAQADAAPASGYAFAGDDAAPAPAPAAAPTPAPAPPSAPPVPLHNGPLTLSTDEHADAKSLLERIKEHVEDDGREFVHALAALLRHIV